MTPRATSLLLVAALFGCSEPAPSDGVSSEPAASEPEQAVPSQRASAPAQLEDGTAVYGGALSGDLETTPLQAILSEPAVYAGRRVRTEGVIERVCAKMGCWMELAGKPGGAALRAPLSGHSYFLPQSVVGKRATVEGKIELKELSAAQKRHLESEGARATEAEASLLASAVAVHP